MKRRTIRIAGAMLTVLLLAAPFAFAQGGGASTTGTIQGRVVDASGAVLPGVTVMASSPSMMGVQNTVTTADGLYRFPAVPPGQYTLTFELPGFNTLKRENVDIALGFTATINVDLKVASLQETVTVTGESPVIDTSATRVQQNFKLEQLQSLPNARDMWSLLAVSPGVSMSRIDVGGNRAGTQTGYTAYGFGGQVRVLVEGINTTEGTGGAGFYFDYGSFEEVFLGTAGQGAEMPTPGVQSQFLGKSGGNKFQGEIYQDYERNSFQGENLSESVRNQWSLRRHSNEITKYRDFNLNVGGPIKKDKLWWYFSYRDQKNAVAQPNFLFDKTFDTRLWNPSGKATYLINQNHKLIGYYQWGQKIQPNRLPRSTYTYTDPAYTWEQNSGSWVYKAEWNGTLSNKLYVEARYGDFGYYFPLLANTSPSANYYWRDSGSLTLFGGDDRWQNDRDRMQGTAAATYFADNFAGTHSLKFGGEVLKESQWVGYLQSVDGHIEHVFSNGTSSQVVFDFPTATEVGKLGAGSRRKNLLQQNKLDQEDLFFSDQWTVNGRLTLNLGVRWDRYRAWVPEQKQIAFEIFPGCASRTDIICAVPDFTFPEQTFKIFNSVVPRLGVIFNLTRDGKTVIKANYGKYYHNPGPVLASDINPNQVLKTVTYNWNDLNGDRHFQIGEQVGAPTANTLQNSVTLDPNLKQAYTHEVSAFLEREVIEGLGARVGYVYKTEDDLRAQWQAKRPFSAYTQPFYILDLGPNGVSGGGDDRAIQVFGIPNSEVGKYPVDNVVTNIPRFSRYKTIEASLNKRHSRRWSATVGAGYTWLRDFPNGWPTAANPNILLDAKYAGYGVKASGSYDGPWGIKISPILRFQAGPNFGRNIGSVTSTLSIDPNTFARVSCNCTLGSTTVVVESWDARRQDNITLFDIRGEKIVSLGRGARVRLFADVFNIFNKYAAETIGQATGTSFLRPTAILAPRTLRIGFRFVW